MKKLFILIISLLSAQVIFAQCFSSTGNPIGGNANMGVSNKNVLRLASFYKHAYSGRYFHGDELSIDEGHITADHAVYNYVSLMSSYGITNNLTAEVSTGYYLNKTKEFETPMTGKGFSNAVISAKYAVYKNPIKRFEITAKAGAKIPLRQSEQKLETSTIDISKHPDVQSCLGNYGFIGQVYFIKEDAFQGLRYFLVSKYEHNFPSQDGYFDLRQFNFGNSLNTSFYITQHLHMPPALSWLTENWTAILQLRHEHKWQNQKRPLNYTPPDTWEYGEWEYVKNSGSDVFFLCPQLNYTFAKSWNVSLLADIPLHQNYKGIQLASDYAIAANITWDINLSSRDKGLDVKN